MIVRIYTGQDGQTHFEDLPQPTEEIHNVTLQAGANLMFRRFAADYSSDWHTAPRRQYILALIGFRGEGGTSHDQSRDEGSKESFASAPGVMHELEEAEIQRQLLLRDAPVWPQPGA
jgi:hypothetical protein